MFIACKSLGPVRFRALHFKVLVLRTPHKVFVPTHCFHETWQSFDHKGDIFGRKDERLNPIPIKFDQGLIIIRWVESD